MATASIQSEVTAPVPKASVTDASRDDLEVNDVVQLTSVNVGTAYSWIIAYKPEGSAAAFSGSSTAQSPGDFTVDEEGSYLIRLEFTDATGTTEQYVRLRALTELGSLKLVAAGERVDTVNVPVDITAAGWADEQNGNLLGILGLIRPAQASGKVLYVDPEQGDYQTLQSAMAAADAAGATPSDPYVVLARPALYTEDLTFFPNVHLLAWPGDEEGGLVRVRNNTVSSHLLTVPVLADSLLVRGIFFEQTAATASGVLDASGSGSLYLIDCDVLAGGAASPQGPALTVSGSVVVEARRCTFRSNAAASIASTSVQMSGSATTTFRDCRIELRGMLLSSGSFTMYGGEVTSSGEYALSVDPGTAELYHAVLSGGTLSTVAVNPSASAAALDQILQARWSALGTVSYDSTGTGTNELKLSSCVYTSVTFPVGAPATYESEVLSKTLFYDNTSSGLTSSDVQEALDEVYTAAIATLTLDDAYNGGDPGITGSGRTIVASAGPVQIVDASSPSDPIPAANGNGSLEVVSSLYLGAVNKPEISLDPNPYGNGPSLLMGREIWANDNAFGSSALFLADSTGAPTQHNYNWRGGTRSASGGGQVGRVILRGGDSLDPTVTASSVYMQAGTGTDAGGGDGGSLYVAPGGSTAGNVGLIQLVRVEDATAATLTAAGAFVGGVTGLIRFATEMGAVEISIDAADLIGDVITKFDATGEVTAADSGGGVLRLTTTASGPNAEVFFLNAEAGVDAALGAFSGQSMVAGTWPSMVDLKVSADGEITIGSSRANPLIYNAITGKLTVPGLIDPTGMIFTEAGRPATAAGEGAIYVSDGTNGETQGALYYRGASDALPSQVVSSSGGLLIPYHRDVPEVANDTVEYRGWAFGACRATKLRVYMATKNTAGNYTMALTNNATGNTMLLSTPYDMNSLTADAVTSVDLTGVSGDLEFADGERWTIAFTSDSVSFNGEGIYFDLVFEAL